MIVVVEGLRGLLSRIDGLEIDIFNFFSKIDAYLSVNFFFLNYNPRKVIGIC